MNKLIGKYINGNYIVLIYEDGTKIRLLKKGHDEYRPSFAENCDVHISSKCDRGCEFCYAGCSMNGKFGNILNKDFLDSIHPHTEMAINLNFPAHPDLEEFLTILKSKSVLVNATVNQTHLIQHGDYIDKLITEGLINALGVSLVSVTDKLIELLHKYKNTVLHAIVGVIDETDMLKLINNNIKLLLLGYKQLERGISYLDNHTELVKSNTEWLNNNIMKYCELFDVIAFDNLALEQLDMKNKLSEDLWEKVYMGDDGTVTFYIDLVEETFSPNSVSNIKYKGIGNIDNMFNTIINK